MTAPILPSALQLETEDRLRHVLVVGKTGMGKSTLLRDLILSDAREGRGLLLVDPHGDLAAEVRERLPRRRRNDLVLFDAADPSNCPGLNPLRRVDPSLRSLVVSNVLATMRKLWPENWGPRTEHVLRHSLLALTFVRGSTLEDVRGLLLDERVRRSVVKQVKDPRIVSFFALELAGYAKPFLSEVLAPILNKLGALLATAATADVLTKRKPVLDARAALDRGSIVLASLPKGRIGEDGSLFLGGLLLSAFQSAALGRSDIARDKRTPFFLYVDEVQSFATGPFLGLIAEARKYGLGLVLATQSLATLDPEVRAALLGNVGTLVAFRVGADDADLLARELVHEFEAPHLMRLAVGEAVVRIANARPVVLSPAPA